MLTKLASSALNIVQPGEGRLLVLIYHRVLAEEDLLFPREMTAAVFKWQMDLLAQHMSPLPLVEGVERLYDGTLPSRAVAVTFDDGYADNRTIAAPILTSAGVPATFFVASGYLDGGRMWNDTVIESVRRLSPGSYDLQEFGLDRRTVGDTVSRRSLTRDLIVAIKHRSSSDRQRLADRLATYCAEQLPADLMMTSRQVQELAGLGFEIGGHTVSHPILKVLPETAAMDEMRRGRAELEAIVGRPLRAFAYPNGRPGEDYGPEHVAAARELGFSLAVSTRRGVCSSRADRWQLPRFTPWDRTPVRFLARMLLEYRNAPAP